MALHNTGEDWLPFPNEFNSDLNWSLLQSSLCGTPLLTVHEAQGNHLPPSIGHPKAEFIFSELVGVAITEALRQIKGQSEMFQKALSGRFPNVFADKLKREACLFLGVERAVHSRLGQRTGGIAAGNVLSNITSTFAAVADRLKSVEHGRIAADWLDQFTSCRETLTALRGDASVQSQIRRLLFANIM